MERLSGRLPAAGSFARIVAAYSEPHRYYHTASHIASCLREFDGARALCSAPDEVEFAIWLHDVVYDPHACDNEDRSAAEARRILTAAGSPEATVLRVEELVLATKHLAPPRDADQEIVVDVDLSILGMPPELFRRYEENIRKEYAWVPEERFRKRRSALLERFLTTGPIYRTEHFRRLYEDQARRNLAASLSVLRGF